MGQEEEQRLRNMLEAACRIGDAHCEMAIKQAFQLKDMRRSIHKAIALLRAGRINYARRTLEGALKK